MKAAFLKSAASLGVGLWPGAPGTYGSALTAGLAWLWLAAGGGGFKGPWFAVFLLVLALAAVAASQGALNARVFGPGKDPSAVVIDEAAGQMVALWGVVEPGWALLAAFGLFRLFDVWKPFPINVSQRLPGGWGIVVDDILAGLAACGVLRLFVWLWPVFTLN